MSDGENKKNGCLSCLGVGCLGYILLCIGFLVYYWWSDDALGTVKSATFKEITLSAAAVQDRVSEPWHAFLKMAEKNGIHVKWKLEKAIAAHKILTDVRIEVMESAGSMCRIGAAMKVKGKNSAGQEAPVTITMVFLAQDKSILERQYAQMISLDKVFLRTGDYSDELRMTEMQGFATKPGVGLLLVSALYMSEDTGINEIVKLFLDQKSKDDAAVKAAREAKALEDAQIAKARKEAGLDPQTGLPETPKQSTVQPAW